MHKNHPLALSLIGEVPEGHKRMRERLGLFFKENPAALSDLIRISGCSEENIFCWCSPYQCYSDVPLDVLSYLCLKHGLDVNWLLGAELKAAKK